MNVKRLVHGLLLFIPSIALGQDIVSSTSDKNEISLFELGLNDLLNVRVVTAAAGFEQSVEEAPASVTVINAEEWEAMGATRLFEALQHVPGLHITKAQTAFSNNRPVVRGLSGAFGQQILILIDGLPFRHIRDGGTLWGQRIPLNAFKRIEVIRSPGSAIYGADAVGGIINLVSYKPGEMPSKVTARAGDFDTQQMEWSHRAQLGDSVLQVALGTHLGEGDRDRIVRADLQTLLDQMYNTSASRAPGPMEDEHEIYSGRVMWQLGSLDLRYMNWSNRESGNGAGVAQALDPEGSFRQQAQTLSATYDLSAHVTGDMNLTAAWHRVNSRLWSKVFPAGARVPIGADGNVDFANPTREVTFTEGVIGVPGNDDQAMSLQLDHIFDVAQNHRVRWAIGYEHVETDVFEQKNFGPGVLDPDATVVDGTLVDVTDTPYVYLPNKKRNTYFLALQDQWRISDTLQSTLGVRYDHYSDFGSTFNPRLGLSWQTTPRLTSKLFLGTAFRAPSFADLYTQNNPAGMGNPDLEPETINTLDGGLSLNYLFSESLHMELNLFRYEGKDMITFVPAQGGQVAQNSGQLEMHGLEYQLSWRSGRRLTVDFNYSLLDDAAQRDVDISSVPKRMANLTAHWRFSNWHWYTGAKWVGSRERAPGDLRPSIDDYLWLDTRLETSWRSISLGLSVKNLTDEDAREPSNGFIPDDYPLAGRHWLMDVSYVFSD
ncbi:MAG: TonB-dependent receptor [Cellvibrionaceae bacterium]|nr:TonB-dependent receptor [Cellvibrionaceae bacterium]